MDCAPSDFIELNRRFRRHDEARPSDQAAGDSYLMRWGPSGDSWQELLGKPGVHVILGEAGSGRTYEFGARADLLRSKGQDAFFVSLHRLTNEPFANLLGDKRSAFLAWRKDKGDAWFFLDA